MINDDTESRIRRLALSGDVNQAVTICLTRSRSKIEPFLRLVLNDAHAAEEAYGEYSESLLVGLLRWARQPDQERAPLRRWVYTQARVARKRHLRATQRGQVRTTDVELDHLADSITSMGSKLDRTRLFAKLRASMSVADRELLTLCHYSDLSSQDVAKMLGLSACTVRQRMTRLRTSLRKAMATLERTQMQPMSVPS